MWSRAKSAILRNESGAIAPTFALSLFALVAVGGIGFDYARLAAMDSELQNAADQAALAAVSQLDGQPGACSRASGAAVGLVANRTLLANEVGGNRDIVVTAETACDATGKIRFWQNSTKTTAANGDANARFVEVQVNARTARYALTPIVGAISSGAIDATAFAGLGSAICKVPPVMFCNPSEPLSNTNVDFGFDANAYSGVGMKLITGDASAPGNFGFLETGFGSGAANLARAVGYNDPPGECSAIGGVTTKPGLNAVVMNAVNTRFDLSTNGANTCPSGGTCSPSRNVRKDLVKGNNCGTSGNQGWQEANKPYLAPSATVVMTAAQSNNVDIMGHPRDLCHAFSGAGACTADRIGNGVWDRDAYFKVNYGWNNQATWTANTGLSASATRYQVYNWELNNTATSDKHQISAGKDGYSYPVCRGTGITPGGTNVDRRRISAAVLNCKARGLNGSEPDVPVLKWVDLFLVEPSFPRTRTSDHDVYVEVIGETGSGTAGATAGQVVRKDTPYLIE